MAILKSLVVLTIFREEVDDGVCLTIAIEVSQLRAAVDGHVVNSQTPLAAAAGVQHRTLQGHTQTQAQSVA